MLKWITICLSIKKLFSPPQEKQPNVWYNLYELYGNFWLSQNSDVKISLICRYYENCYVYIYNTEWRPVVALVEKM